MTKEQARYFSHEIHSIAHRSHSCWNTSLQHITGMDIRMGHSFDENTLFFTFTDGRLPDEYYYFDYSFIKNAPLIENEYKSEVAKFETIDLRKHKNKRYKEPYPYIIIEHPESVEPTEFLFWGRPIRFEKRKAWTEKKPDFEEVAKIMVRAINEFKQIYNHNTALIPKNGSKNICV
jgi:hypothetical protein